jgi:hypothetical protein
VPEQNRVMQALLKRRNLTERVRIVENEVPYMAKGYWSCSRT